MSKKMWFLLWGGLFVLCAALGFLPEPVCAPTEDGGVCWLRVVMTILSVVFFLPPAVLLHKAGKEKNVPIQQLIRNLSALSLGLTLVMLILNFWSALGPEILGSVLHYVLVVVSTPMICSGQWALSLFLWACLLMVSLRQLCRK